MKEVIIKSEAIELSYDEMQCVNGGENIIEYFVMLVGYCNGASDKFYKEHDFSNGYVGSKI